MRLLQSMSRAKTIISSRLFLLKEMVIRDMRARYAGSSLGLIWAVGQPILWMALYSLVFSLILRVPVEKGYASFAEFLLAGLLPWMAIQEGISRSASALTDNAAMVKKTVFPLETLVLSVIVAALINQVIAFGIFAVYVGSVGHLSLAWITLVVPALLLQTLLTFGIGCYAATVTTFLRDAAQVIGIGLTVVFWATPVVYPMTLVPSTHRWLLAIIRANPLTHLVEWYRGAFTTHVAPSPSSALYLLVFCLFAALSGAALFARARPHFADLM
jgi:homopolymeric O-antigen transport system permease protein